MKTILIHIDDHEHQRLKAIKGHNRTWKEFMLQLAGIQKEAGDEQ